MNRVHPLPSSPAMTSQSTENESAGAAVACTMCFKIELGTENGPAHLLLSYAQAPVQRQHMVQQIMLYTILKLKAFVGFPGRLSWQFIPATKEDPEELIPL